MANVALPICEPRRRIPRLTATIDWGLFSCRKTWKATNCWRASRIGSPAQEAGVRSGDVLLKVNGTTITKANCDGHRRFSARAGTKINLTLSRSGEIFKTTVILRDILLPTAEQMK